MVNIVIKNIQDSLKDNECHEVEFKDNIWIVVAKDEIFVKDWTPVCPTIPNMKLWNDDLYEKYTYNKYEQITDFDNVEVNDVIATMLEECKYSLCRFGE